MQIQEITKEEIERRARGMADFLRMEYLELCLKRIKDINIARYCCVELSKLYEKHSMFSEAIKYLQNLLSMSISEREKKEVLTREIELLIKAGSYERANERYHKLITSLSDYEKISLTKQTTQIYKTEIEKFEKLNRLNPTLRAYESLLAISSKEDAVKIKEKLLILYKKLGKVKESLLLEKELSRESDFRSDKISF